MNKCLVFSHLGSFLVPSVVVVVVVGVSTYCCMLYHTWCVQKCIHLIRALDVLLWSALHFALSMVWWKLPCLPLWLVDDAMLQPHCLTLAIFLWMRSRSGLVSSPHRQSLVWRRPFCEGLEEVGNGIQVTLTLILNPSLTHWKPHPIRLPARNMTRPQQTILVRKLFILELFENL